MTPSPTIDEIRADFRLLDDWEDRYRYVIELGRALPALAEEDRTEANKVRGCASQVWLARRLEEGPDRRAVIAYDADSDAHIVRGLIAIVLAIFSGRTAEEILATDASAILADLGLHQHLTPQRSNGLASMVARIRSDARQVLERS